MRPDEPDETVVVAALVQVYHFAQDANAALSHEAKAANAPFTKQDLLDAKRDFAVDKNQRFEEEITRRVDDIKRTLKGRPKILAITTSWLTMAIPLLKVSIQLLPLLAPAAALLSLFGLAPMLTTAYKFIAGIPIWLDLLGITLPFSYFTFVIQRFSAAGRNGTYRFNQSSSASDCGSQEASQARLCYASQTYWA